MSLYAPSLIQPKQFSEKIALGERMRSALYGAIQNEKIGRLESR